MTWLQEQIELVKAVSTDGDYKKYSTEWLRANIVKPTNKFVKISPSKIKPGKFYWLLYNLGGKSTKVEKFNPTFILDFWKNDKWTTVFALNTNFIPEHIRCKIFDDMTRGFANKLSINYKASINEPPLPLTFDIMYNKLLSYGFEWAIRELVLEKIDAVYEISFENSAEMLLLDTKAICGLDETAINKIWKAKVSEQRIRQEEMILRLRTDIKPEELKKLGPKDIIDLLIKSKVELNNLLG